MAVTLGIYWITPWIRWDRGPYAPDQAVLVDVANRRFYFFFIEIWPQEFYYVAGLLIMAGLGLFLVTSVAGRVWCGYTCPQTVWTDLYHLGRAADRGRPQRPHEARRGAVDGRQDRQAGRSHVDLAADRRSPPAAPGSSISPTRRRFSASSSPARRRPSPTSPSASSPRRPIVFAGFMREQVCTYMCPWPRIQGAMLDEDSLLVTYNDWRGEPRSRHQKKAQAEGLDVGDCVDCNACVAVCPMGIDIRDGNQLECITCAFCIDACDGVMEKLGKPQGLISYTTLRDYNTHAAEAATAGRAVATAHQKSVGVSHIVRPRTILYFGLWCLVGLVMLVSVVTRDRLDINVLPDRNPLYVTLSDGSIRNGYTLKVLNMTNEPRTFEVAIDGLPGAGMWLAGDDEHQPVRAIAVDVEADRLREIKVFVSQPGNVAEPGLDRLRLHGPRPRRLGDGRAAADFYAPGGVEWVPTNWASQWRTIPPASVIPAKAGIHHGR